MDNKSRMPKGDTMRVVDAVVQLGKGSRPKREVPLAGVAPQYQDIIRGHMVGQWLVLWTTDVDRAKCLQVGLASYVVHGMEEVVIC